MTRRQNNTTNRITRLALLTAIALTIFMVEAQIPSPVPLPGVKLGLSNIVTVWVMFTYGARDAGMVLAARIFLGAVFSGQMSTILYSGGGGLLAWQVLILMRKVVGKGQIWLASPVSALFHNLGQLLVASAVMKTWAVMAYLPYLVLSGVISGFFTGWCAQFLLGRLDGSKKYS